MRTAQKAIVVPGTPATNLNAPTPSQIKAGGASNPYVIAEIRVNADATTILDSVITDKIIQPRWPTDV